jgi:hypothetical protein
VTSVSANKETWRYEIRKDGSSSNETKYVDQEDIEGMANEGPNNPDHQQSKS